MPPTELPQRALESDRQPLVVAPNGVTGRKLVGVDGKWYDVTHFVDKHPGGPVIEKFIGQDASQVFHSLRHNPEVLKHRPLVGTYTIPKRHPADEDFERLIRIFEERGYYKTDWEFYFKKTLVVIALITAVVYCIGFAQHRYVHYLGGVILAFVWQQSGFIMHEFMHTQLFRNRLLDKVGGLIYGTVVFGMSAHWWQDEHIFHHAMTNTVDIASRFVDPQMWEVSWAQHPKLFPLFKGVIQYLLIKIQHITFVPVVMLVGRFEILSDSYRKERRWYEWISIALHWTWVIWLFGRLPSWWEIAVTYGLAASVEGIFHFQLILSHYCRDFFKLDEYHNGSWYEAMILSNMNIDTYRWLDWYYGGLNFHIEHHLFPKMARRHLRDAGPMVEAVCKKHNIEYDRGSFWYALTKTLSHLRSVGDHYKLDPR